MSGQGGVTRRTTTARGLAVVAAALLAAGALSPALGAAVTTKKQVKQVASARIPVAGGKVFIEESELVRYGPIQLNSGQAAPVGSFGPLRLTVHCQELDFNGDGPPLEERGRILIRSLANDSAFDSDEARNDDLDIGEVGVWASEAADDPGVQEINSENDEEAHASAADGTRIAAWSNTIVLNHGGFDCTFTGATLVVA